MKTKHILLIDDDPDEYEFFLLAIDKVHGTFKCSYAIDQNEAIQAANHCSPDYIFVDMKMPKANGIEMIRKLKSHPVLRSIPLYLYTTFYDPALDDRAIAEGALGCIRKPPMATLLADMLNSIYLTGVPQVIRGRGH